MSDTMRDDAGFPEPLKPGTRMLMWFTVDPTSPIGGHLSSVSESGSFSLPGLLEEFHECDETSPGYTEALSRIDGYIAATLEKGRQTGLGEAVMAFFHDPELFQAIGRDVLSRPGISVPKPAAPIRRSVAND